MKYIQTNTEQHVEIHQPNKGVMTKLFQLFNTTMQNK